MKQADRPVHCHSFILNNTLTHVRLAETLPDKTKSSHLFTQTHPLGTLRAFCPSCSRVRTCSHSCRLHVTTQPTPPSRLTNSANTVPSSAGMLVTFSCHVSQKPSFPCRFTGLLSAASCTGSDFSPPSLHRPQPPGLPARAAVTPLTPELPRVLRCQLLHVGKGEEGRGTWFGPNDYDLSRRGAAGTRAAGSELEGGTWSRESTAFRRGRMGEVCRRPKRATIYKRKRGPGSGLPVLPDGPTWHLPPALLGWVRPPACP